MKRFLSTLLNIMLVATAMAGYETDEHGLILSPADGEEVVYQRQGCIGVPVGFQVSQGQQEGQVTMVYCADGSVYMQHPLSICLERSWFKVVDTWIKGTKEGDLITFPSQPISYSSAFHCTISLAMGNNQTTSSGLPSTVPCRDEMIVFKERNNGKMLELQNSDSDHVLAAYYDDDDASCYYWEYQTVLMREGSMPGEAVTPPDEAEQHEFILSALDSSYETDPDDPTHPNVNYMARLAWWGDDVFLGSFSFKSADCWIKGHREGEALVFDSEQFLKSQDNVDLTFYALPEGSMEADPEPLVLTYDALTGGYEVTGQDILISHGELTMPLDYVERLSHISLYSVADVDPKVISRRPAGIQRTYQRQGLSVGYFGTFYWARQEGSTLNIITAEDGETIYMQDPITMADNGHWVKGKLRADGHVSVPLMQWIQQDEQYGSLRTALLRRMRVEGGYVYDLVPSVSEVSFSIDEEGTWSLDPLALDEDPSADPPMYLYGLVEPQTLNWVGFGDCGSIYVPTGEEEVIEDEEIDISDTEEGEMTNEWGIIVAPGRGTEQTYQRQGNAFKAVGTEVQEVEQEGMIHLVMCPSGTVYMQQPVSTYTSAYAATSWIKGKRIGDRLCFPANQPINYSSYYEATMSLCLTASYYAQSFWPDRNSTIEFEVSQDGRTLTLLGTVYGSPLGVFYDDDDSWTGYGDFGTVLTYVSDGHEEETVAPDPSLPVQYYLLSANDVEEGPKVYNARLVMDGTTAYLGSFCFYADDLWIKGYKEGNDLVFPKEQYLRSMYGYDLFLYGAAESHGGYSPCDLRLSWDEDLGGYQTDQHLFVTWGKITSSINRAEELTNIRMVPDANEGAPYILRGVPEGELRIYSRTGGTFGYEEGQIYMYRQEDVRNDKVELMYDYDGRTVYMHNPISSGVPVGGSWVQGYRDEEERLHFPLLQWVDYSDTYGYGFRTALLVHTSGLEYVMLVNIPEVTFSLDPQTGVLSLDRIPGVDYDTEVPNILYGLVYSDDYGWGGYGDWDSVYYPDFEWQGLETIGCDQSTVWYDLMGRRVAKPAEGQLVIKARQ